MTTAQCVLAATLSPTYVAAAWLYGYTVAMWTHNVYIAPSVFCTLRFGIVWLAVRAAPTDAQMRVHVAHIGALFLGGITGTALALSARTHSAIDVSVARGGRLRPLGALWLLSVFGAVASAFVGARLADDMFTPAARPYIPVAAAASLGFAVCFSLLVVVVAHGASAPGGAGTPPLRTVRNVGVLCTVLLSVELLHAALQGSECAQHLAAPAVALLVVPAVAAATLLHSHAHTVFIGVNAAGYAAFVLATLVGVRSASAARAADALAMAAGRPDQRTLGAAARVVTAATIGSGTTTLCVSIALLVAAAVLYQCYHPALFVGGVGSRSPLRQRR